MNLLKPLWAYRGFILSNNTDKVLVVIEVQTGANLNESDIIRFDDNYGRT